MQGDRTSAQAAGSEGGPAPRATYAVPRGSGDAWGSARSFSGRAPRLLAARRRLVINEGEAVPPRGPYMP